MVKQFSSLAEIRAEIDALDMQLVALLAQRLAAVAQVPAFKSGAHEARVEGRVQQVIDNVRTQAHNAGFDADAAERIWRNMIEECIAFEHNIMSKKAAQ